MQKSAIIGTTSWGITLGLLLAGKGSEVRLWTRTEREANRIRKKGLDQERFNGITLPENIIVTSQMAEVMDDVSAVILAVPSSTMRQNISQVAHYLNKSTLIISAANETLVQQPSFEVAFISFHEERTFYTLLQ